MPKLPQIDPATARVVVSRSTVSNGAVVQSPVDLLAQARASVPSLTADEYALARVVASELGNGLLAEQVAIADCDATRARMRGRSVFAHVTGTSGAFGQQGSGGRLVATSKDPTVAHCQIARAVLGGAAAGFARGGHMYFDPLVQWRLHAGSRHALHPLVVLDKWTFNRPATGCEMRSGRWVCDLGAPAASGRVDWVGPIESVRPERLMIFRASPAAENYTAARAVITRMLGARNGASTALALLFLWGAI